MKRIQINATRANDVDISKLNDQEIKDIVSRLSELMTKFNEIEFIFQINDETEKLYKELLKQEDLKKSGSNYSFLFDSFKGKGVEIKSFSKQIGSIPCGYAGGIGVKNVKQILKRMQKDEACIKASKVRPLWIDMESSLREVTKTDSGEESDKFSLEKVKRVIEQIKELEERNIIKFCRSRAEE